MPRKVHVERHSQRTVALQGISPWHPEAKLARRQSCITDYYLGVWFATPSSSNYQISGKTKAQSFRLVWEERSWTFAVWASRWFFLC